MHCLRALALPAFMSLAFGCSITLTSHTAGDEPDSGTTAGADSTSSAVLTGTASPGTSTSGSTGASAEGTTGSPGACTGSEGAVVYVNFDGVTLKSGIVDDARSDTTDFTPLATTLDPYPGTDREEILSHLRRAYEGLDVCVTDERPMSGSYHMIVVTPTNPLPIEVWGIMTIDCGNANSNNVAIVFAPTSVLMETETIGRVTASTLAFTFGLDRVESGYDDVMQIGFPGPTFVDQCMPLYVDPDYHPLCDEHHQQHCAGSSQQNSWQELLSLLGPAKG